MKQFILVAAVVLTPCAPVVAAFVFIVALNYDELTKRHG